MSQLAELTAKLKEIFQINRADLDFGIYRILNTRSQEIEHYLSQTLPQAVKTALGANQSEQITLWQTELAALQKNIRRCRCSTGKQQEISRAAKQNRAGEKRRYRPRNRRLPPSAHLFQPLLRRRRLYQPTPL